jgi:hypothetical protein
MSSYISYHNVYHIIIYIISSYISYHHIYHIIIYIMSSYISYHHVYHIIIYIIISSSTFGRKYCFYLQGKFLHHNINMSVPLHDSNLQYQENTTNFLLWLTTHYLIHIGSDFSQHEYDKANLKICGLGNVRFFASLNWMEAFNKNKNWCSELR